MYLGAHMSVAGGLHLACERGRALGCDVIQIFVKNQRQWKGKAVTAEESGAFRRACLTHSIRVAFAHASYLINMASPASALRRRSVAAFVDELERCEALGLASLVVHPGSPGEAGQAEGLRAMIRSLDEALKATRGLRARPVLETSAGQGACVGCTFREIQEMIEGTAEPERIGVCIDTCHVFAAGYDIRTRAGYDALMEEADRTFGIARIAAIHVNDSKKGLGSRVDRHENIGQGALGLEPFRCLMTDARLARIPKVLETPKDNDMDAVNLRVLRELAGAPRRGHTPIPV